MNWKRINVQLLVGSFVLLVSAAPLVAQPELRIAKIVVTPDYVLKQTRFSVQIWVSNVGDTRSADFDLRVGVKQLPESPREKEQYYLDEKTAMRRTGIEPHGNKLVYSRDDWRVEGQGDCEVMVWLKPVDGTPIQETHRLTQPLAGPIQSYAISPDQTGGLEYPEIIVGPEMPTVQSPFSIAVWMRNRGRRQWDDFSLMVRVRRVPQGPAEREWWYIKDEIRCRGIPATTAALMHFRKDWQVNDPGVYEVVVTIQREKADDMLQKKQFVVH